MLKKSNLGLNLTVLQAATLNKLLPFGIKILAEERDTNFAIESDDEGSVVMGVNKPTSRQAQLAENKSK